MRFEPAQSFFVVFRKLGSKGRGPELPAVRAGWPSWPARGRSRSTRSGAARSASHSRRSTIGASDQEDGIRYYSGTAIYRKTFDAPGSRARAAACILDLGTVKNLARVRLNGQDLGVVWCAPWRVDITGAVKARDNQLEIAVANLWPNRLIGDQSLPPEKRLTSTTWNPFKKDSPLAGVRPAWAGDAGGGSGATVAKPKSGRADASSPGARADRRPSSRMRPTGW